MITVEKIWEGVRLEGVNYGLPQVFLKLGQGDEYPSIEKLVQQIMMTTQSRWACILGENTTQVGMGTLIKGLSAVQLHIELECSASIRDPGWVHTVDRWMLDYVEKPLFDIGKLRSQDMIRFTIESEPDVILLQTGFERLKLFEGYKCVNLKSKRLYPEVFNFVRKFERSRIYLMNGARI